MRLSPSFMRWLAPTVLIAACTQANNQTPLATTTDQGDQSSTASNPETGNSDGLTTGSTTDGTSTGDGSTAGGPSSSTTAFDDTGSTGDGSDTAGHDSASTSEASTSHGTSTTDGETTGEEVCVPTTPPSETFCKEFCNSGTAAPCINTLNMYCCDSYNDCLDSEPCDCWMTCIADKKSEIECAILCGDSPEWAALSGCIIPVTWNCSH